MHSTRDRLKTIGLSVVGISEHCKGIGVVGTRQTGDQGLLREGLGATSPDLTCTEGDKPELLTHNSTCTKGDRTDRHLQHRVAEQMCCWNRRQH